MQATYNGTRECTSNVESELRVGAGHSLSDRIIQNSGPQPFCIRDQFCGRGMVLGCAFHFYSYYVTSTSDHQALDPGIWGPLS